jgi:pyruvate/2-oxoglutarate/acetoin dehydrogenase E1 component
VGIETLDKNTTISADVLDLRTLQPLDTEAIFKSVKTGALYLSRRFYVWWCC